MVKMKWCAVGGGDLTNLLVVYLTHDHEYMFLFIRALSLTHYMWSYFIYVRHTALVANVCVRFICMTIDNTCKLHGLSCYNEHLRFSLNRTAMYCMRPVFLYLFYFPPIGRSFLKEGLYFTQYRRTYRANYSTIYNSN